MAADRAFVCDWLSSLAGTLVGDELDARDIATRLPMALSLEGGAFALESLSIMRVIAESVDTPAGFDAIVTPQAEDPDTKAVADILVAFGLSIAAPRVAWTSRPQARAARSRIAGHGETALASVSAKGTELIDLYEYLSRVVEIAVLIVSGQAANAVPVVRVETGISLPSTVLAYHLYGDAARADGVVDIAGSATPMLMPVTFEALES